MEAGALALMVAEASTLLNLETKVAMEVPAAAVAMAVAGGSNYIKPGKWLLCVCSLNFIIEPSNPNVAEQCNIVNIIAVKWWILS